MFGKNSINSTFELLKLNFPQTYLPPTADSIFKNPVEWYICTTFNSLSYLTSYNFSKDSFFIRIFNLLWPNAFIIDYLKSYFLSWIYNRIYKWYRILHSVKYNFYNYTRETCILKLSSCWLDLILLLVSEFSEVIPVLVNNF